MGFLTSMIHRWSPGCRIMKLDTVFRAPLVVGTTPDLAEGMGDDELDGLTPSAKE